MLRSPLGNTLGTPVMLAASAASSIILVHMAHDVIGRYTKVEKGTCLIRHQISCLRRHPERDPKKGSNHRAIKQLAQITTVGKPCYEAAQTTKSGLSIYNPSREDSTV